MARQKARLSAEAFEQFLAKCEARDKAKAKAAAAAAAAKRAKRQAQLEVERLNEVGGAVAAAGWGREAGFSCGTWAPRTAVGLMSPARVAARSRPTGATGSQA